MGGVRKKMGMKGIDFPTDNWNVIMMKKTAMTKARMNPKKRTEIE